MFDIVIEKTGRLAEIEGDFPIDEAVLDCKDISTWQMPLISHNEKCFRRMRLFCLQSHGASLHGHKPDA